MIVEGACWLGRVGLAWVGDSWSQGSCSVVLKCELFMTRGENKIWGENHKIPTFELGVLGTLIGSVILK